jgi:O-antigen/teichoic acid export membrane protein
MSNIRVTYSGLIAFLISTASVFTGIFFTVIVTRSLTPDEFGTWSLIGGLITYVIIIEPIISMWTTREQSRGIQSGATSVLSSGVFSVVGIGMYLIIAFIVGNQIGLDLTPLYLAALLIPTIFLTKTLNAVNWGIKPHSISIGLMGFELTKIPVALVLVYFLDFGLSGAIISTVLAYVVNIIILLRYAKDNIRGRFKIATLKKWLKLSWLPMYPGLGNILLSLDVAFYSLITGSVIGLAYYAAGNAIANVVGQSGNISKALYPKLLSGGKIQFIEENIPLTFYFALPLVGFSMIFAKQGLFILNPLYDFAVPIVIILSVRVFLDVIAAIYSSVLSGLEKVDLDEKSTFLDYVKSKLFVLPTLRLIQFGSYSGILAFVIFFNQSKSELELVTYMAIIALFAQIFYTAILGIMVKKNISLKVNYNLILKYSIICIGIFGFTYFLMEEYLIYEESIFKFIPNLVPFIILAITGYIGITYVSDKRTREFVKTVLQEIKK